MNLTSSLLVLYLKGLWWGRNKHNLNDAIVICTRKFTVPHLGRLSGYSINLDQMMKSDLAATSPALRRDQGQRSSW